MKTLVGVCSAVLMSAAMLSAQAQPSHNADKSSDAAKNSATAGAATVTFTGCLSPGSKSDPFFLTSAKQKGVKGAATTVKLVPADKKVDLGAFVTHEIEVTGTLDQPAPSNAAGQASTLTVTKVKSRTDQC